MPRPLSPTPPRLLPLAAVLAGLLGLGHAPARAQAQDGWTAGISAGGAGLRVDQRWRHGLQLGAEARYGLADFWALRGAAHFSWHPEQDGPPAFPPVKTGTAAFGLTYAWDVLRVVPFAEAGVALSLIRGAVSQSSVFAGVQLGGGFNYLIDRQWAVGGALRFQYLLGGVGVAATPGDAPMQLGFRVGLDRLL
jgi:hypothetical protein